MGSRIAANLLSGSRDSQVSPCFCRSRRERVSTFGAFAGAVGLSWARCKCKPWMFGDQDAPVSSQLRHHIDARLLKARRGTWSLNPPPTASRRLHAAEFAGGAFASIG